MKSLKRMLYRTVVLFVAFLALPVLAQAQNEIKGHVIDQKNVPVVGASVIVKGTMNGTMTDDSGAFSISASAEDVLEISCIGFETLSLPVASNSFDKIVLNTDSEFLDEVVVVGFGVQKKVNLTGSVSAVDMDKVLKNRPIGDVGAALQGAMPGLQITTANAMPGTAPSFNVRGYTSINGGSPLILVDNVPMDISMVDPADIENVSVLKDAASSAIYGARAAYGVILVTTKKGTAQEKAKITYNNNFAFSNPTNLPEVSSPLDQVKAYLAEGDIVNPRQTGENLQTWAGLLEQYNADPSLFPEGKTDVDGITYYLKDNDHIRNMMDKYGFQHKHNISLQGAFKKNSYRLSFGYLNEDGILYSDKDRYQRYNISAYWKVAPFKWLDVSADVKYADAQRSHVESHSGIYGLFGGMLRVPSFSQIDPQEVDGTVYLPQTGKSHLILAEPVTSNNRNLRVLGTVNIRPVKGLVITGEYSYMYDASLSDNYINRYLMLSSQNVVESNVNESSLTKNSGNQIWNTLNVFATYNNNINGHDFTIMGGYNQESKDSESLMVRKYNQIVSQLPSISQSTGLLESEDSYSDFSTRSLFYRLDYSYKNRYLFETTGRYDGSSRFPKKSRFGFFPSASVAWRLDNEKFLQKDWLSLLKLRASVGTVGNQSIANYAFIPTMDSYMSGWMVGDSQMTTTRPPHLVSSGFTWETVITYDWAIEARFWDRLSASFNYYIRDTKDMLTEAMQLPGVLGTEAPKENAADLRTQGWELEMSWKDRIGKDFYYNIGFNLYDSRSHITKFANSVGLLSDHYVGEEIGEIWGYETAGLYQPEHFNEAGKLIQEFDENGKLVGGLPNVEFVNQNPGDVLYVDQNGDGVINKGHNTLDDHGDLVKIGNKNRRLQYAINAGFSWKGIDFSFILTGVGKRELWNKSDMIFPMSTPFSVILDHQLDYWTPDNPDAFHARMYERAGGNTPANRMCQSRYLLDGSYLKIKNISLAYTFPKKMMEKIHIGGLSLFVSAENVHTFYKTPKGFNPESATNESGWYYPEMTKISFGLNLTL